MPTDEDYSRLSAEVETLRDAVTSNNKLVVAALFAAVRALSMVRNTVYLVEGSLPLSPGAQAGRETILKEIN